MPDSIHTARWLAQIADQGWEIHLFPSVDYGLTHPEMKNIIVHHSFYGRHRNNHKSVKSCGIPLFNSDLVFLATSFIQEYIPNYRKNQLVRLINKIKPDIIHSLEIQHAGYLTLEARKLTKGKFPPWIVTNWGSDIYLFGRLSDHEPKIRDVLTTCDYYSSECQRDVQLAKNYGLKGKVLPVFPNTGGFDKEQVSNLCQPGLISKRRVIMLKGYQGWAGRALVGLRALERCADLLNGYEIAIYSASSEVIIAAELFTKSTGIHTKIIPAGTSHGDILKWHGKARISIGLSISDAISTSMLEAIVMGSFPIQSNTSCAYELIVDGKTGILVHPDDPEKVESAIRRALTDDLLVDQASGLNFQLIMEKFDQSILKPKVIEMYQKIYRNHEKLK